MSKTKVAYTTEYIYKSRVNILKLLKTQGYDVDDYDGFSIREIHSMIQSKQLDMLLEKTSGNGNNNNNDEGKTKKVYVKYHLVKSLNSSHIWEYVEDLFNLEEVLSMDDDLVIITKDEPNATLTQLVHELWEKEGIYVNLLFIKRLQFNILEHSYVPKHRIMSADEIEEFKRKYQITKDSQIPEISRFDPVAAAICMRPGNICEIVRNSKTAITSKFYRICV
jgi:DNA-directed RNA polymerase subunit H (RpoH/RPB5)